jgi:hypothetical protein
MGSHEHLHLIERLTRADLDTLQYEVAADDPTTAIRFSPHVTFARAIAAIRHRTSTGSELLPERRDSPPPAATDGGGYLRAGAARVAGLQACATRGRR